MNMKLQLYGISVDTQMVEEQNNRSKIDHFLSQSSLLNFSDMRLSKTIYLLPLLKSLKKEQKIHKKFFHL